MSTVMEPISESFRPPVVPGDVDPSSGRRRLLVNQSILIGRGEDCQLRLPTVTVSRHHCLLRIAGSLAWITDLHSSNGTFVNGQPLPPGIETKVTDGAQVTVGAYQFVVRVQLPVVADDCEGPLHECDGPARLTGCCEASRQDEDTTRPVAATNASSDARRQRSEQPKRQRPPKTLPSGSDRPEAGNIGMGAASRRPQPKPVAAAGGITTRIAAILLGSAMVCGIGWFAWTQTDRRQSEFASHVFFVYERLSSADGTALASDKSFTDSLAEIRTSLEWMNSQRGTEDEVGMLLLFAGRDLIEMSEQSPTWSHRARLDEFIRRLRTRFPRE